MAKSQKTRFRSSLELIDLRRLVFVREDKHVYSELIFIADNQRQAQIYVNGFNMGLNYDSATQEAFTGIDFPVERPLGRGGVA